MTPLEEILDLARWAPSGDNTQPWRFSIEADDGIAVHGHDTRDTCVYDLDGHASQVSLGALLETIGLAATRYGFRTETIRRERSPDERPVFDVRFRAEPGLAEHDLVAMIPERRVHRRPLRVRPLSAAEKEALTHSVEPHFRLVWFETASSRARIAWLNFVNARIRLTLPEAYAVHRDIIHWDVQFSEDRIPATALGASAPTLMLMRWAMRDWSRIRFLNRYLAGTVAPRVELDLLPGLACAAHVLLVADAAPAGLEDYVRAGGALQRLWLTATRLGLQFQPEYTPLVFARYAREGRRFTQSRETAAQADAIRAQLDKLLAPDVAPRAMFMGRIGAGSPARSRSLRLPLERLLQRDSAASI